MDKKLIELFNKGEFEELEKELKKLYPQIDCIEWNADKDGDIDLHIVFVKMPYMLPFSGSSYAHFVDLDGSKGESNYLEQIMSKCRVIEKEDIFKQYSSIEFDNYYNDLVVRGYDLSKFDNLDGEDYSNTLWELVKEIRNKEGL